MKRFLGLLLLVSCGHGGEPEPVIRPQPGADLCDQACAVAATKLTNPDGSVGCDFAQPVWVGPEEGKVECDPGGPLECLTCAQWCVEQHQDGLYWNTQCIVEDIATCAEVESVCNVQ